MMFWADVARQTCFITPTCHSTLSFCRTYAMFSNCQPPGVLGCIFRPSSTDVSWRIADSKLRGRIGGVKAFSPRSNDFLALNPQPGRLALIQNSAYMVRLFGCVLKQLTFFWKQTPPEMFFFFSEKLFTDKNQWSTNTCTTKRFPNFPRLLQHVFLTGYFRGFLSQLAN